MSSAGQARAVALAALETLERQVHAQQRSLAGAHPSSPVPPAVLALLAAPAPPMDIYALPPDAQPRLAALADKLTELQTALRERQRRVGDRIDAVARSRRAPQPAVLVDWRS